MEEANAARAARTEHDQITPPGVGAWQNSAVSDSAGQKAADSLARRLRIIQVVNVRWVNATAWYGLFLARLLKEAGHEVLVLGLEGTDSFKLAHAWGLESLALPLNNARPLNLFFLYRRLAGLLRSFRPDVVNCHRGESFLLWGWLKKKSRRASSGIPPFALVRTRGDRRPLKNSRVNRLLHGELADALIATNSAIARAFTRDLGVAAHKVHVIVGGVDDNIFYPDRAAGEDVRRQCGFGPHDFVVGLLGRLDEVKGHAVLIRAFGLLKARCPELRFKFLCIGADSALTAEDIRAMLARVGIEDPAFARVTGRVDNVRAYINALDLGVLASIGSEAIARAALEIMACGVPLLSSDVGVMPDLLPSDLLVPAGDAPALALALEKYHCDPQALESLGRAGRQCAAGLKAGDFRRKTLGIYEDFR